MLIHRIVQGAALAAICLTLAACGGATASQPQATLAGVGQVATLVVTPLSAVPIEPLPTGDAGVPIVARVNGSPITLERFQRLLERAEQQEMSIPDVAAFQDNLLSVMIEQAVINQAAAAQGISVSDADLDAEIRDSQTAAGSSEAWIGWLTTNGYTEAEFRESLRDALVTARLRDAIVGAVDGAVPYVRARHILVSTEAEAQDLLNQLNAGADFGALAAQYSLDATSKASGGDLNWFAEDELLQPALAYAAFHTELNALVGPVRSALGYHVLQVLERENRPIPEERRAALAQARFTNWLTSAVAQAAVERYLR